MFNFIEKLTFEYTRFRRAALAAQTQYKVSRVRAGASLIYARIRYGHGPQSHSLYRLAGRHLSQWPSYLWEPKVLEKLAIINPAPEKFLARNKIEFYRHCLKHGIPTIPILFSSTDLDFGNELTLLLQAVDSSCKKILFKPSAGAHGAGVFFATRVASGWAYNGVTTDLAVLYHYCETTHFKGRSWICQPAIEPHDELKNIMAPGALGTVRLITYLNDGYPKLFYAVLRIPANNNITDNFSQGTKGNIVAAIDMASGNIGAAWHSKAADWPEIEQIETHPNTRHRIPGQAIPHWKDVQELVLKGQSTIPQLPTLGWDIAITNTGPMVVEANTEYGIDLLQIAHNRGLRDEMSVILDLSLKT